jgi:predicted kinase
MSGVRSDSRDDDATDTVPDSGTPIHREDDCRAGIEIEHKPLRFTKDEWVKALYGHDNPRSAEDVIEGRLIHIGLRVLELGNNVVIDYGLWGRDERSALRQAAADLGAMVELRYFDLTPGEQRRRLDQMIVNQHTAAAAARPAAPVLTRFKQRSSAVLTQADAIDPSVTSPLCAAKAAKTSSFSRGGTPKWSRERASSAATSSNSSGVMWRSRWACSNPRGVLPGFVGANENGPPATSQTQSVRMNFSPGSLSR